MKLLIAYDGSRSAEQAIESLAFAGLPGEGSALVLTVAESWLTEVESGEGWLERVIAAAPGPGRGRTEEVLKQTIGEAATLSSHAAKRLRELFPGWGISAEAKMGSPANEILKLAESFHPDLLVVGSQGRSGIGNMMLGSISQKVLTAAGCSVRVGRRPPSGHPGTLKVIIGFDGSPGALSAVDAVSKRYWDCDCSIRLVTASNELVPTAIGRFIPPVVEWVEEELRLERQRIEAFSEQAFIKLKASGCVPELRVRTGNPRKVLVEEAARIAADTVFVGSHSFSSELERHFIGSTSTAVAARSSSSVEVVRAHLHTAP